MITIKCVIFDTCVTIDTRRGPSDMGYLITLTNTFVLLTDCRCRYNMYSVQEMIDMGVILLVLLIAGSLLALDDLEQYLPEPKTPKTGASTRFNLYLLLGIVVLILVSVISSC
jgi:hypothetical protein